MLRTFTNIILVCFTLFFTNTNIFGQCAAGDMQTTGDVTVAIGSTFDLMVLNQVVPPAPGAYGWVFDNANTDGTGGTGGAIILRNQTGTEQYDNDLSGILSSNNFLPLQGTWVVRGAAYTDDADSFNTICDLTSDSLVVTFETIIINCEAGDLQTTGDITVTPGNTFDLMVINQVIPPAPGNYGWVFDNTNTNGTGGTGGAIILRQATGTEQYDNDLSGILSSNNFPVLQGTWVIRGASYTNDGDAFNSICDLTADSLVVTFGDVMMVCEAGTMQTIGTEIVCKGAEFNLETSDSDFSTGSGLGWLFSNDVTGGTGALGGSFVLTGITATDTLDEDLDGVLSFNNFPIMEGTWVAKSVVFTNAADPFNSICSTSADSLILVFNEEISFVLQNDSNTSVSISSMIGGTPPFAYAWSNGETTATATDLSDGDLTLVVTDAGGCTAEATINLLNTSVEDIEGLVEYDLGPNPTSDMMNLTFSLEKKQNINISIRSLDGKLTNHITNEYSSGGNYQLDLSAYNSGVYLLHITTEDGQYASRIVKK